MRKMHLVVWVIASIASIILMMKLRQLDSVLKSPDTPLGIVGYEFAWTRERAESMLRAWRGLGVLESARESLLVDFVFLLAYPISLGLGCRLLARRSAGMFDHVGVTLSYAVLVCMPLDAVENLALLRMLESGASDSMARVAAVSATIKFGLVLVAIVYLIVGLLRNALIRAR